MLWTPSIPKNIVLNVAHWRGWRTMRVGLLETQHCHVPIVMSCCTTSAFGMPPRFGAGSSFFTVRINRGLANAGSGTRKWAVACGQPIRSRWNVNEGGRRVAGGPDRRSGWCCDATVLAVVLLEATWGLKRDGSGQRAVPSRCWLTPPAGGVMPRYGVSCKQVPRRSAQTLADGGWK